jgi:hypothetical protein
MQMVIVQARQQCATTGVDSRLAVLPLQTRCDCSDHTVFATDVG